MCLLPSCHSFYSKRYSRALYLGAKAIQLNSNSVQALLLKGAALRNMGRVQEAIIHFREAMRLAPCRLDCYEGRPGFVHCTQHTVSFLLGLSVTASSCHRAD